MKLLKRLGLLIFVGTLMAPITFTAVGCESDVDEDAGMEVTE
ncbi:MAG: hypothetical protein AAGI46_14825 [Planctomycetota bacterium]